ncbi:MAG: NAD(P)H-dependent oxidoreductase [Pirellulales bacterium]|nr:NAD(P)H-dependent oxidoreductase [Pirellulales bacterium]
MQISLILAHPDKNSFNHAIAETALKILQRNGHDVRFHDLCAEGFDPYLPREEFPKEARLPAIIESHCREIAQADGIIVVHPNWWGQPPAVLKGWVDRIIRPGVAYEFVGEDGGEGVPRGLLKARAALVFNTGNTEAQREIETFGDPLESIWKDCIFGLCGVTNFYRRLFGIVITSTGQQRKAWLEEVAQTVDCYFPES